MKSSPSTPYCRQGARHWFAYYGLVGSSAPTCQRCGVANPNYDPARDDKANDPFWRKTPDHMIGGRQDSPDTEIANEGDRV